MSPEPPIRQGQYTDVDYLQFHQGPALRAARVVLGVLTWPVVWPLALVAKVSDMVFRTISELLSVLPYLFGVVVRGEFYRFALRQCGTNVTIEFGTIFIYPDVAIGDHVIIGRFNIIHHCDFGSYALTGERCTFLGGSRQHNIGRTDIPMALQGGKKMRIVIGDDCWIGAHAIIMADVGRGAIVGAGAVVTRPVPELTIVVGNPAHAVRQRGEPPPA
jgi:acetyltransferase-like isoleucine patch superfamily enzyme